MLDMAGYVIVSNTSNNQLLCIKLLPTEGYPIEKNLFNV